jgi:hypothetical protein
MACKRVCSTISAGSQMILNQVLEPLPRMKSIIYAQSQAKRRGKKRDEVFTERDIRPEDMHSSITSSVI